MWSHMGSHFQLIYDACRNYVHEHPKIAKHGAYLLSSFSLATLITFVYIKGFTDFLNNASAWGANKTFDANNNTTMSQLADSKVETASNGLFPDFLTQLGIHTGLIYATIVAGKPLARTTIRTIKPAYQFIKKKVWPSTHSSSQTPVPQEAPETFAETEETK